MAMCLPIPKRSEAVLSGSSEASEARWGGKAADDSVGSSSTAWVGSPFLSNSVRSLDVDPSSPLSPQGWRIRNTFLDTPKENATLLQGFQIRRRSTSVPAMRGREADERADALDMAALERELGRLVESDEEELREEAEVQWQVPPPQHVVPPPPRTMAPPPGTFIMRNAVPSAPPAHTPLTLILTDLVKMDYPTPGSELHHKGECKPCAFFWKPVGCKSAKDCQFCHLCDSEKRKRRSREKKMAMYAAQNGGA